MCVFVSTLGHPPGRAVSRTVSGCVGGLGCRSCSLEAGLHTRLIGGAPGCWCCAHPCVCRRSSASSHTTRSVAMAARGGESGAVRATHRWISGLSRAALLLLPVVRPSPTEPTRVLSMNLTPGGRTRHTHCDGVVSRGHPTRPRFRRLTCSTCARLVCAAPPPGSDRVRVDLVVSNALLLLAPAGIRNPNRFKAHLVVGTDRLRAVGSHPGRGGGWRGVHIHRRLYAPYCSTPGESSQ